MQGLVRYLMDVGSLFLRRGFRQTGVQFEHFLQLTEADRSKTFYLSGNFYSHGIVLVNFEVDRPRAED
jgi:hypothetical protein